MLLKWPDVLRFAKEGNPVLDRKVIKTQAEWREQVSPEQYLLLPLLRYRTL
jgi:peptide-methionine (R)-S-oxide reductase